MHMKWLRIRLNGTCQAGKQVYGRCMSLSPHTLIESLGQSVDIGLLTLSSTVVPFFLIGAGLFRPVSFFSYNSSISTAGPRKDILLHLGVLSSSRKVLL